ncbi:MAG: hypothetical protein EZS28_002590 [Streblomastix strix]|uniref:Uncharacterized protein n=1 Tax=Streblomastix strix TaxID=222440 RepID=A0A5J4X500_9EUKA|nr:MAG: hypothetical protein EZS28_002590 [Streblomastix strix]
MVSRLTLTGSDYVTHISQGALTSFIAHLSVICGHDRTKWMRLKDYEAKMKQLFKRVLDYDTQMARHEVPEDFFRIKEKRNHYIESIKPLQSQIWKNNVEQIAHANAILCVIANTVAQLREIANAQKELRDVVGGIILPADIFSDDSFESNKRQLELKKVNQIHYLYQQMLSAYPQFYIRQPQKLSHLYQRFQRFLSVKMQYPPLGMNQFSYRRRAAIGAGYQAKGSGARGSGAFRSNFTLLDRQ